MRHQISPVAKIKADRRSDEVTILPASLPGSRWGVENEIARAVPTPMKYIIALFQLVKACLKIHRSGACQNFKRQGDQILCSAP
jgi:hypothetical protein